MRKFVYWIGLLFFGCGQEIVDKPAEVSVETLDVSDVGHSSAFVKGVTSNEGSEILTRGFCWDSVPSPTIQGNVSEEAYDTGEYSYMITALFPNTTYYVRAFITDYDQVTYGEQMIFTTKEIFITGSGVSDVDGNYYTSIILGDQEWMSENLKTTKFSNGDLILSGKVGEILRDDGTPKWYYYDNEESTNSSFGKLYNLFAVSDIRNICPDGWHVPTEEEWFKLVKYLDPEANYSYNEAGGKMKAPGSLIEGNGLWQYPNTGEHNSGFSALPGGFVSNGSTVSTSINQEVYGYWWCGEEEPGTTTTSADVYLKHSTVQLFFGSAYRREALSCRCVKD